jgi:hypothetical protein
VEQDNQRNITAQKFRDNSKRKLIASFENSLTTGKGSLCWQYAASFLNKSQAFRTVSLLP